MLDLSVNFSFFFQLGLFLLLFLVLRSVLFGPLLNVLERREKATDGTEAEIVSLNARIQDLSASYDRQIEQARIRGGELQERLRRQASQEAALIIDTAKKKSDAYLETVYIEVEKQREILKAAFDQQAKELGQKIVERILH